MSRPLMQHGVAQLEQMFAAHKSDFQVLKQVENELRYRQVPRAISLLAEVQAALYSPTKTLDLATVPPPATPTPSQKAPIPASATPPPTAQSRLWSSSEAGDGYKKAAPSTSTPAGAGTRHTSERATEPPLAITVTEALSLFKANAGTPWETVEQTRRLLVQVSSPSRAKGLSDQQRTEAVSQARRINAAYELLSLARAGSRG